MQNLFIKWQHLPSVQVEATSKEDNMIRIQNGELYSMTSLIPQNVVTLASWSSANAGPLKKNAINPPVLQKLIPSNASWILTLF